MSDTAATVETPLTAKTILLIRRKDGTHLFLTEAPTDGEAPAEPSRCFELGTFNDLTARTAQSRLQFRFAAPSEPLTEEEIGVLRKEIHRQPF